MQADTSEFQLLEPASEGAALADNLARSWEARSGKPRAPSQGWQFVVADLYFLSYYTASCSTCGLAKVN